MAVVGTEGLSLKSQFDVTGAEGFTFKSNELVLDYTTAHHGFYSHDIYGHHGFYGHFFGSENADNTPNHAFYGQITVFIATFSSL